MRKVLLLVSALALVVSAADSQRAPRPPRRPKLAAGADSNDATAYLNLGHRLIEDNATAAGAAYYWAARIDPASADALYGLRTATLMRRPTTFQRYMEGREGTVYSREMRANDSLYLRALQIDPFLFPRHRRTVEFAYFRSAIGDGVNQGRIDFFVEDLLNRSSPAVRARVAVGAGQFALALDLYTEAIGSSRNPVYLYLERGGLNAMQGHNEAAIADYQIGLTELRNRDLTKDSAVVFYSSKALHEHSVGLLQSRRGDLAKAREAFGRAMEEDLSFHPSHLALAQLALTANDTTTALSESALAAELAPLEAHVQHRYGEILGLLGRHADAIAPLRRAIELEPYYAAPHDLLGQALEMTGDGPGAREAYERFLALSPRREPRRTEVTRRIGALGGSPP